MKRIIPLMILTAVLAGCEKEASSVGIIGGADGPTAVLVGSSFPIMIPAIIVGVIAVVAVVSVVIYLISKKD